MKILLILVLLYGFLIWDFHVSWTSRKTDTLYEVQYVGLLWVALDRWTIKKYNSPDAPKKWLAVRKTKLTA